MAWTALLTRAAGFDANLLNLAFVFLLLGYGTKAGLTPVHAWLPDAHAEGPTPISAVLSGLLLNVALYAILRFKMLVAANQNAWAPGTLMIAMGLSSLIFAAFMLYRRRDIKRLFAYSSIEHIGVATFAFGLGGPLANFGGPAAYDDAQPDQIRDLFRGRPHRAGQGDAAHRRNPRSDRHASDPRLGSRARGRGDCRHAAAWPVYERIPDRRHDRSPASPGSRCRWSADY